MIACIYLASGYGKRFGSNKLRAPFQGKPLFRHGLNALRRAKAAMPELEVIVVSQYQSILVEADACGMKTVRNADPSEGITTSIRLGVEAAPDADWYAFFVADQPALRWETITRFLRSAVDSGKTLASVHCEGVPGNPTAFQRRWREGLLALHGDKGGRRILKQHPDEVWWYAVPPEELKDADTLQDLLEMSN